MKHLKKLSVVLMITTLFSASFTSCIDTEVSPVVEAIYEAQADLIAAQTAVQNAEAALRTAQANAAQAQADYTAAQTAQVEAITDGIIAENSYQALKREQQLLKLVAETNLAVAQAQMELEKEQAKFNIKMVELLAKLEEAKVQVAIGYAIDYRNAMWAANNIWSDLLTAKADLADAELMLVDPDGNGVGTEVSYAYHLAMLTNAVAEAQASVDDIQAKLDLFNEHAEDPIAAKELLDAQKIELKAQYEILQQKRAEQEEVIDDLQNERDNRNEYVTEIEDAISKHNTAVGQINDRNSWISNAQNNIADWQAAMTNYDAIKATLEQAVVDAEDRIGYDGTGSAADHEHNHPLPYGLLGDIDAATTALGPLNTAETNATNALGTYTAPVVTDNYIDPTVTAYDVLFNAELAILKHDQAYAALTATYNAAATALSAATAAYNAASYQADYDAAVLAEGVAQTNLTNGITAYNDAKADFELNPSGSLDIDTPISPVLIDDLDFVGIHTDDPAETKTYVKVSAWSASHINPANYAPSALDVPETYNGTDVLVAAADIVANDPNIAAITDVILWNQDGTATDGAGAAIAAPGTSLAVADASAASPNIGYTKVYFLEVESDDDSESYLYTFNVATNLLGLDDFSGRAIIGNVLDPNYNPPLTITDANAFYTTDNADANGEYQAGGTDALTLYALLWNAKLETATKLFVKDNADANLQALQDAYDAQKLLYDEGLVTRAGLVADAAAIVAAGGAVYVAQANLTAAQNAVIAQQDVIDALEAELGSIEYITSGTAGPGQILRELNDGNLFISWDVHANDGVPAANVMYEYRADAGWETAYDGDGAMGDADALTAYAELWNAQEALARHTETTLAQYQDNIDLANADIADWENEITIIQARLDANLAIVNDMLPVLTDLGIEYTFEFDTDGKGVFEVTNDTIGGPNSYADIRAEVIAENKVLWDIDREIAILDDQIDRVNDLIAAWNSSYNNFVNTIIPNLEASLVTAQTDLAEAQAALALATNDEAAATANIEYLEAKVETLEARYANALAIAEKYKALLDAALAS
ncbi:hypothetical protein [uncultured Lutibacter sp.]|uniref:hypothetical protein n=1 Tax=uncultured Lutibacter sp. TaxID=437739 RepID=UPI0026054056|nr:hypothetical protein [uncultured Lutibacter sp.]